MDASTTDTIKILATIKEPLGLAALGLFFGYSFFLKIGKNLLIARYMFVLALVALCGGGVAWAWQLYLADHLPPYRVSGYVYQGDISHGVSAHVKLAMPSRAYDADTDGDGHVTIPIEKDDIGGQGNIWALPTGSQYVRSNPSIIAIDRPVTPVDISVGLQVTNPTHAKGLRPASESPVRVVATANQIHVVESKSNATPLNVQTDPSIPTQFWFNYPFNPQPGKRVWIDVSGGWIESYPDGQFTRFVPAGTATVDGCRGPMVSPESDKTFQVFIPSKGCQMQWTRFRSNNGQWSWLGEMMEIKYPS